METRAAHAERIGAVGVDYYAVEMVTILGVSKNKFPMPNNVVKLMTL